LQAKRIEFKYAPYSKTEWSLNAKIPKAFRDAP
jgi:hypothetical protein